MSTNLKIAKKLIELINADIAFTDANIRPGMPLFYRSPAGYVSASGESMSEEDIHEFCQMADGHWEKKLVDGDGQYDCGMTLKGSARLRCNIFRFGSGNKVGVIIRKLPVTAPDIDKIGISFEIKRMLSTQPKGLFLVTGPTGSGKSTTLAAIIEHFNQTKPFSIVTIEEPIEYEFEPKMSLITQREVPTNVTTFHKGIVSAKRQDPDVIMVGELRDRDTVDAALTAACSGHLVLATTHARSAQESCESLLSYYSDEDVQQKRSLLASSLIAINSQVLLPSADKKSFVLGYELLTNTAPVSKLIREGNMREIGTMIQTANTTTAAITSLNQRLQKLVEGNVITKEEAIAHAYNKDDMQKRIGMIR